MKSNTKKPQVNGRERRKSTGGDSPLSLFPSFPLSSSVTEIGDVVVGVTPVALGGVVGDSQMVEAGQEDEQADNDDGDGAVRVLQTTMRVSRVRWKEGEGGGASTP